MNTSLIHSYGILEIQVNRKKTKLLIPWESTIPKILIRNTIKTELQRVKRIPSNFVNEITLTRSKFKTAGYPICFINSTIGNFTAGKEN